VGSERLRVLFVGNSYTFYNDMPATVARLADASGQPPSVDAERVVQGGADVRQHWEETGARERIAEGGWDCVVIQGQSTGPLRDPDEFREFGGELARATLAAGAQPLLYLTWARAAGHEVYRSAWSGGSPAAMLDRLRAAYEDLAARVGARVVPVGPAWALSLHERPDVVLHDEDLHHASPAGSYLAACVFLRALTGIDPRRAPFRPADVAEEHAAWVRGVAARVVA
jgi:hypothetical protein